MMTIKLFQPKTKNWLLIAEQLDDPETWDRFVPTHGMDSQRFQFDSVATHNAGTLIKLKPCKDLLRRGTSVFEYDWETEEDTIISHAMQVAESLGVDLSMEAPAQHVA